jgi:hypothetical protein
MKGQLIFEFIVAGLIFFAIVLYTINYLNVNMSDFSGKFYQNRLQSKAIQIAEILVSGESRLSIADDLKFNLSKIQEFNNTYCPPQGNYTKLALDLYLYEKTDFGIFPNNAKIGLLTEDGSLLLDCGPRIPRNMAKGDIERIGLFQGKFARLMVTVW